MYYKNDPIKQIINVGVIIFKIENNMIYILLCHNLDGKYDLIYQMINFDYEDNIYIDDIIIERVYNSTNYQILLDKNSMNEELYDDTSLSLIKFIKLNNHYLHLKSTDFNLYEIISDEKKIKRELKWIELKYFNNFILKNNKITQRLKNKDITKILNKIYKNYKLCLTLNKVRNK
jgi:hypothetical protein